jgi:hypothetical protein
LKICHSLSPVWVFIVVRGRLYAASRVPAIPSSEYFIRVGEAWRICEPALLRVKSDCVNSASACAPSP